MEGVVAGLIHDVVVGPMAIVEIGLRLIPGEMVGQIEVVFTIIILGETITILGEIVEVAVVF